MAENIFLTVMADVPRQRELMFPNGREILTGGKVAGDDIHFAIIRVGHGHGENWADAYADTNMDGCDENGIPYGVYFYSEATNEQEATLEVNNLLERLKGRNPQLGVFVDVEATDVYQKAGIDPYKDGDKIVELADLMLGMCPGFTQTQIILIMYYIQHLTSIQKSAGSHDIIITIVITLTAIRYQRAIGISGNMAVLAA